MVVDNIMKDSWGDFDLSHHLDDSYYYGASVIGKASMMGGSLKDFDLS